MQHLAVGLNPYGLTWTLGLQGAGTPRANPAGDGLERFLAIAGEIGARVIDLHNPWLTALGPEGRAALKLRLERMGVRAVVSAGLPHEPVEPALDNAVAVGAGVVRLGLTTVLCGDRASHPDWAGLADRVAAELVRLEPLARGRGLTLAIENHQDFTSAELLALCEAAGEAVGICLDTGNAFPVAETPMGFAARVAPRVRHVHLKDYRVQMTGEGFRLVRCAIGEGAVPIREMLDLLLADGRSLTAVLEPAALEARHVRLFTEAWWQFYPHRDARDLAAVLLAARRNHLPEGADYRTPWEMGAPGAEIAGYERAMILRSAANMRAAGVME